MRQRCTNPCSPQHHRHRFVQRLGPIDDNEHLAFSLQAARDQVLQKAFDDGRILSRSMPDPQNVLFTLQINADGGYQAIPRKGLQHWRVNWRETACCILPFL